MSIRVAIIGSGIMGEDHARIIANDIPGANLQVVCDAAAERAKSVADQYGAQDAITDPFAAIQRHDVDAIIIASPDETHAPLTLAAIDAGKPVLCEKPLAPTQEHCLQVIHAEVKAGRQFAQLGFMRRFDPSYTEMKRALQQNTIGKAIMMHHFHRNVLAPANFTGQMAISNSAPHEFDVARFILDCEYISISVFQPRSIEQTKAGAPVFMVLETNTGQLVNIEINNNAAYGYDVRGELVGESGSICLNTSANTRIHSDLRAFERYAADWRSRFAEAYRLQNKAWLAFVNTGMMSPLAANTWDGYCATRVAVAGVQALCEGKKVMLERAEKPALYANL